MKGKVFLLSLLLALMAAVTFAQTTPDSRNESKTEAKFEAKKDEAPNQTARLDIVSKIFDVKYRNPQSLVEVLNVYVGPSTGRMSFNREMKTIMVRDRAENVAAIEEALKRFDVPESSPVSLEFQLHLISASMGQQEKESVPANLTPVIQQIRSALKFTNYRYVNSSLNRVSNGGKVESSGIGGSLFPAPQGVPTSQERPSFYSYSLGPVKLTQDSSGKESIQIDNFRFGASVPVRISTDANNIQYKDIGIITPLSLREGEMVVVGTANISGSDEAVVVIISVKKAK